jgi:hypothetical protein
MPLAKIVMQLIISESNMAGNNKFIMESLSSCTYIGKDDLGYNHPTVILAQGISIYTAPIWGGTRAIEEAGVGKPRAHRASLYSLLTIRNNYLLRKMSLHNNIAIQSQTNWGS